MKPTYQVRIWHEDGWWLARVMAASEGADASPLNALTQARSLARIESMGRDLIATILDAGEDTFDVEFDYLLPGDSGDLVCQAKGARAWLEAAQDLWQQRSAAAARALAGEGYSLRETAALLGLSHQRVDQILGSHADRRHSSTVVICEGPSEAEWLRQAAPWPVILVVGGGSAGSWVISRGDELDIEVANRFRVLLHDARAAIDENRSRTDELAAEHGHGNVTSLQKR
jgi:DnaJ-domain-containing protein 1